MNIKNRIIRNSVLGILLVVAINFFVLYSLNFPQMALFQIKKYLILLILLVLGFGVQIGLYTYLKHKNMICSATMATSGGISSASMILCCSHYIATFIPFISLSLANFLTRYTLQLLLFGILSNLIGILIMVIKIKKNERGK